MGEFGKRPRMMAKNTEWQLQAKKIVDFPGEIRIAVNGVELKLFRFLLNQ